MPFDRLKVPFSDFIDGRTGNISRVWRELIEAIADITNSFPWTQLDFTGSNLTDIETRNHSGLQNIGQADETSADATKDKHVSNAQLKTAYDNIAANTADIATNTADIATNTANIATNTSDIADNLASIKSNRVLLWLSM